MAVGWQMADERALALLAPGRVTLSGLGAADAAMGIVDDYLTVAATVDEHAKAPKPPAPDAAAQAEKGAPMSG
jgi:hypothetical protein